MLGTWYGPDFSNSRNPVMIFSDSRDPIFNSRDPNRVPKTRLRKPWLKHKKHLLTDTISLSTEQVNGSQPFPICGPLCTLTFFSRISNRRIVQFQNMQCFQALLWWAFSDFRLTISEVKSFLQCNGYLVWYEDADDQCCHVRDPPATPQETQGWPQDDTCPPRRPRDSPQEMTRAPPGDDAPPQETQGWRALKLMKATRHGKMPVCEVLFVDRWYITALKLLHARVKRTCSITSSIREHCFNASPSFSGTSGFALKKTLPEFFRPFQSCSLHTAECARRVGEVLQRVSRRRSISLLPKFWAQRWDCCSKMREVSCDVKLSGRGGAKVGRNRSFAEVIVIKAIMI